MTMEHFAYPWMNAFFGEKADDYRYAHLMSALEVIPYMVCVDEFQHKVFENIGMTIGIMPVTGITLPFLSCGGATMTGSSSLKRAVSGCRSSISL